MQYQCESGGKNVQVYAQYDGIPVPTESTPVQSGQYVVAEGGDDSAEWYFLARMDDGPTISCNITVTVVSTCPGFHNPC